MDTQPILSEILEEAKQAAQKIEAEASERAGRVAREAAQRADRLLEQAQKDADLEAEAALSRARRLSELEDRKWALGARRELMDRAFDRARAALRALSDGEMERLMLRLVLENASGSESLSAGDVNDGFYTPSFIEKANQALAKAGRTGALRDSGSREKGSCGLVLRSGSSSTYCTVDALVEAGREGLEQRVAALLFDEKVS